MKRIANIYVTGVSEERIERIEHKQSLKRYWVRIFYKSRNTSIHNELWSRS